MMDDIRAILASWAIDVAHWLLPKSADSLKLQLFIIQVKILAGEEK